VDCSAPATLLTVLSFGHVGCEGDSECVVLPADEFQAEFSGQGAVGGEDEKRKTESSKLKAESDNRFRAIRGLKS